MAETEKEEENRPVLKLSIFDKWLLKLPKLSLESFPDYFHGIFFSIVIPVFMILEFFFTIVLLVYVPFPTNLLLALVIPAFIFLYFGKTMVERFVNWYNATFGKPMEWNVDKTAKEYFELLEKQKSKKS
jgi:hypothetical protein